MELKFALILMMLLSATVAFAQPATTADIQALETQVNEMDKRLIRLETQVDEMDKRLTNKMEELDKRLAAQIQAVQTTIIEMDKRLTARIDVLFWAIGTLIGIVLAVIVLPQVLGYFQEKRGREELQKQIQELSQRVERQQWEIEELKARRIVTPS